MIHLVWDSLNLLGELTPDSNMIRFPRLKSGGEKDSD